MAEPPPLPSPAWELLRAAAELVREIDQRPGNLKDFPTEFVWPLAVQAVSAVWFANVTYDAITQVRGREDNEPAPAAGDAAGSDGLDPHSDGRVGGGPRGHRKNTRRRS